MIVSEIVTYPNPILLEEAQAVPKVTRRVQRLARDMLETMYAASGVGLAAPQGGIRQRVIVVDVGEGPITLVNPEIIAEEGEQLGIEECLRRGRGEAGAGCARPVRRVIDLFRPGDASGGPIQRGKARRAVSHPHGAGAGPQPARRHLGLAAVAKGTMEM